MEWSLLVKYVLGIDSGASKYLIRACSLQGALLGEYVGEPAAHFRVSADDMALRITTSVDRCLEQFGGDRADCVTIVCGAAGVDFPGARALVSEIYRGLPGFDCPIHCVNDSEVAHYAATGGVGVIVIAGTGSIAFGRAKDGSSTSVGGWPLCIFGDEGSGAWLARKALQHLSAWFDALVPRTRLVDELLGTLSITDRSGMMDICTEIDYLRWQDPNLAAAIDRAADAGDDFAIALIEEAASATFAMGDEVVSRLGLAADDEFRVGAWGSAIVKSDRHLRRFTERFHAKYGNVRVVVAQENAAMGACRMALAMLDGQTVPA